MRAEFRVFASFVDNATACTFIGDTFETEIFDEKIDQEKATSVNYYQIEGRTATFSIPSGTAAHSLLRNRKLYKHTISRELTRIAVKIYNDNDDTVFFGVVNYTYDYDYFGKTIESVKAVDFVQCIVKYWFSFTPIRNTSPDLELLLSDAIEYIIGEDEDSQTKLSSYFPSDMIYQFLIEINYSGFEGNNITLFNVRDVFLDDWNNVIPWYANPEDVLLFGLHGDTEEGEEFSGNPDQGLPGLGDDSYFLKRIISSGFYYVNDRIELTFMMYEYRHQAFPNPYAQQTLTRKREKIYIKSFLFTPGGQYQITRDDRITRTPVKTYYGTQSLTGENSRLIDTEFLELGYELRKEWISIYLNDVIYFTYPPQNTTSIQDYYWEVKFAGTVSQDLIRFSANEDDELIINRKNALAGCMLINNLSMIQDLNASVLRATFINKLKIQTASPAIIVDDSNSRIIQTSGYSSSYNDSLLDQFIFGVDIREIIEEYYSNLFNKYSIKAEIIIPRKSTLRIGDTIQYNEKNYVIMELDRNYQNEFYKATCYGEE